MYIMYCSLWTSITIKLQVLSLLRDASLQSDVTKDNSKLIKRAKVSQSNFFRLYFESRVIGGKVRTMLSLRSAAARRVWSATGRALSLSSGEMNKLTPLCRGYHSYPDPNEKPVVSTFKSDGKKMGEKAAIALKNSLPMDVAFPGSPTPTGIGKNSAPTIKESTLSNGLTVTSQELPGSLMVTLGFIVKCGR